MSIKGVHNIPLNPQPMESVVENHKNDKIQEAVKSIFAVLSVLAFFGFACAFMITLEPIFLCAAVISGIAMIALNESSVRAKIDYYNDGVSSYSFSSLSGNASSHSRSRTRNVHVPIQEHRGQFNDRSRPLRDVVDEYRVVLPPPNGQPARGQPTSNSMRSSVGSRH